MFFFLHPLNLAANIYRGLPLAGLLLPASMLHYACCDAWTRSSTHPLLYLKHQAWVALAAH
jgi:hypothetical protein